MAHLRQYSYPGVGQMMRDKHHYSTAIRVGDTIQCAGQGGWDIQTFAFPKELDAHIGKAFENCEVALKDAGGKGWSQVYKITSYHVLMNDEILEIMAKYAKQYMPDHQPIWTAVGVPQLALPDMVIEIEVCAHDPEGAAKKA